MGALFPRLVPTDFVEQNENLGWLTRKFPGDDEHELIFVEEDGAQVSFVTKSTHSQTGDELFAVGMKNLERHYLESVHEAFETVRGGKPEMWSDEYDGLRALLLTPLLLRPGEKFYVAHVRRESLFLLPPPPDGDLTKYKQGAQPDEEFRPGMLRGLYWVTRDGFGPVR
ncbi:MAG: hypothetical protein JNK82_44275 [Myxococcaceae bacterium]|nr:hypothetical protein [Myxococcaceae bacterium]